MENYDNYIIYKLDIGETLESVCAKYNCCFDYICKINNISKANAGDRIILDRSVKIHIVKPRETLKSIAEFYGKSEQEIKNRNNCNVVFLGQQLIIN